MADAWYDAWYAADGFYRRAEAPMLSPAPRRTPMLSPRAYPSR
jgi:hypothetical protein